MLRVLFLILIGMIFISFAQTELTSKVKAKPYEVDKFGKISKRDFDTRFLKFINVLRDDPTATGYIIIGGHEREAARQEKFIRDNLRFLWLQAVRLTIVRGDTCKKLSVRLWVIPAGSSPKEIPKNY